VLKLPQSRIITFQVAAALYSMSLITPTSSNMPHTGHIAMQRTPSPNGVIWEMRRGESVALENFSRSDFSHKVGVHLVIKKVLLPRSLPTDPSPNVAILPCSILLSVQMKTSLPVSLRQEPPALGNIKLPSLTPFCSIGPSLVLYTLCWSNTPCQTYTPLLLQSPQLLHLYSQS